MILLLINEKDSEKEGNIVCNVFSGKINVTKTGNVSGQYKKACDEEIEELSSLFSGYGVYRIGQNIVSVSLEELMDTKVDTIIWGYEKNRKVVVLNKKNSISLDNISLEKNKLFIIHNTDVIKIEEKNHLFTCGNSTICLVKNEIFMISAVVDKKVLKRVIFSRRPKNEICLADLFSIEENVDSYLTCEDVKIQVEIHQKRRQLLAEPNVLYFGSIVKVNSEKTVLINGDLYYRDYTSEKKVKDFFKTFEMISAGTYIVPVRDVYSVVRNMIECGFEVIFNQKKLNIYDDAFKTIKVSSGIEWFELSGDVQFDNDSIRIADLIGNGDFYIEGKNQVILVPENIKSILEVSDLEGHIEKTPGNYAFLVENSDKNLFDVSAFKHIFDVDTVLKLAENMFSILYDYQFDGIVWMKSLIMHGYGGCLADDMGLGKTLQILSLLSDEDVHDKYSRALIIAPRTLLGNWISEYEQFFSDVHNIDIYYGDKRQFDDDVDVYITTYGMVISDYDSFIDKDFDLIILDEAQKIKNVESKTRKLIKKLSVGKVVIAATGTPYENNLSELWSIMDVANPGMLGPFKSFSDRYMNTDDEGVIAELGNKVSPFLLRRTKEEVLECLPQKNIENVYCIMESRQQKLYNAMLIKIKKDLKSINEPGMKKLQMLNGLTFLREICCHPGLINDNQYKKCKESAKLDIIKDLIEESIEEKEKIVIFSQFTRFLGYIVEILEREHIDYCYIDGQTSNRQQQIDDFALDDKKAFLISLKAGGFGLNLTNAKRVIIADPWWNPAVERQAEDRIYRIGQTEDVIVYRLIVKNSVEEKIDILKNAKDEIGNVLFENVQDMSELDAEQILTLFNK